MGWGKGGKARSPTDGSRPPTPVQRWIATVLAARCSWMMRRMLLGSTSRMGAGRPCDRAAEAVPVEHPAVVRRTIASAQTPLRLLGVGGIAPHGIQPLRQAHRD